MLQPVRGTHDILPDAMRQLQWFMNKVRKRISLYGYEEIATPIFEFSQVFHRLGQSSDVVSKETYTFTDRGGEELTLRPEGTAGLARAIISNGLTQQLPLKFFYTGPMFRYERPQKGRYRQFDQIGVELLGVATPLGDIEVIALAADILKSLGLGGQINLEINTIGDHESRQHYREALINYFTRYTSNLSEDSQRRLTTNPLRILDSRDARDHALIKDAPRFSQYLNDSSKAYFEKVCEGLVALGIPFQHNPLIVRGLDYYCHTTFEFVSKTLGAQGAVIAGGRYDGLVEQLGGPAVSGIGWGAGVDRLLMLANPACAKPRAIAMIPLEERYENLALLLAHELRSNDLTVEMTYSGNMSKRLKRAHKANAGWAVVVGEDEAQSSTATVRNLDAGMQEKVAFEALTAYFKASQF